jgi:hypothetical protein
MCIVRGSERRPRVLSLRWSLFPSPYGAVTGSYRWFITRVALDGIYGSLRAVEVALLYLVTLTNTTYYSVLYNRNNSYIEAVI